MKTDTNFIATDFIRVTPGMTLRDWFAAQAMAAYIAAPRGKYTVPSLKDRSDAAYKQADAMLAERERAKEKDDEIIESLASQYAAGQFSQQDFYRALVESGRATAKEGDK